MSESMGEETRILISIFADVVDTDDYRSASSRLADRLGDRIFDLAPEVKNQVITDLLTLHHEMREAAVLAALPVTP